MNPMRDCCDEARKLSVENMKMSLELGREAEEIDRMQGKIWKLEAELERHTVFLEQVSESLVILKRAIKAITNYGKPQFDEDNIWQGMSWNDLSWQAKIETKRIEDAIKNCQGEDDG